jgi:hypothetical protein
MTRRANAFIASLAVLACGLASLAPSASASAGPAWSMALKALPANFAPGTDAELLAVATNVGAEPTSGLRTLEVTLPESLTPFKASHSKSGGVDQPCAIVAQLVTCEASEPISSGRIFRATIKVEVAAIPSGSSSTKATVSGGGAQEASATSAPPLQASPVPFGFLPPGLTAPLSEEEGAASTLAGSHPYQQTISFEFPTRRPEGEAGFTNSGHPRDIEVELPRGLIGNPAASPVLCTEAELEARKCPDPSQVGLVDLTTIVGVGNNTIATSPLFNMVPPPGAPAELGTEVANVGLFAHIIAGVRSDGDYGIEAASHDILAFGSQPIFGIQTQIWGDPSSEAHSAMRGTCGADGGTCKVDPQSTAFWSLPSSCPADPITTAVKADSWEEPGSFKEASYESADLLGNPAPISGCNAIEFGPTISSQPTTNLADSPSGLDFILHQPQDLDKEHRATGQLKDAVVTLPQGMSVNPSQADGLGACTTQQIGLSTAVGASPAHFSKSPNSCPDSAKLGTVEVASPLLVERNSNHELVKDPQTGEPIPTPLSGSVYLAKPFDNPFGSLLAIYLAVEDEQTGIVAKLAGKVEPDPNTGQLRTRFEENPQLPLEDVKLHLFGGARGALITPLSCGAHTTSTTLTPWSAPETPEAHPSDAFQTSAEPGGGSCPASEGAASNKPSFQAGTLSPQAASYSPFVLKLSRQDGSQRLAGLDATLPPGLSGKLAGIPQCSGAQLAQAIARSHPNEGILERQSPSCPAATKVGTVDVSAGAGPTPFHTQGTAYLTGPYKGAPLSVAIVTPAIAGPFDLGVVVVRTALYVNPDTAQIHAVSDPIPQILDGIPLDVRSIALTMDRPDFTLNPTSCEPMSVTGSALSALGQSASLTYPFQVGGCASLPFKPKLSLKLKGGTKRAAHPKLIATVKAKPGEANIAKAQVKLPPSAFLDQAHIRTVCTRVQFAANSCPKGSIYGTASATTPLLSDPLSGNVYLRSSNHKLPDLVVALKGPASLPIEIDLDGKTDSVKGALRNTFEAVPDAPVTSFRLELFGGKRGLVINSRNLCAHPYKAEVKLDGQNGKVLDSEPAVGVDCAKGQKGKQRPRHHR